MKHLVYKIFYLIVLLGLVIVFIAISPTYFNEHSKIIHTDIKPDITITDSDNSWDYFHIDLNKDSTVDYTITNSFMKNSFMYQNIEFGSHNHVAEVMCDISKSNFPLCLTKGYVINSNNAGWRVVSGKIIHLQIDGKAGHRIVGQDKYIGVRIKINDHWHYGWIRLFGLVKTGYYTVKDYGYNLNPDQHILAGDGVINSTYNNIGRSKEFVP